MNWSELLHFIRYCKCAEDFQTLRKEIAVWIPSVKIMFDYAQNNPYHQYDLWSHSVNSRKNRYLFGLDKSRPEFVILYLHHR